MTDTVVCDGVCTRYGLTEIMICAAATKIDLSARVQHCP
eukprot:COSAG02_NODE_60126_length_272_cov_0.601156_1_plen_38_part_10